jgi:hypothetical protein
MGFILKRKQGWDLIASHKHGYQHLLTRLFFNPGYSPEYVEEVLHKKKAERATLAIDLQRPTFIKVNRKYLHPDTLDHYGLPWEWDAVCTTSHLTLVFVSFASCVVLRIGFSEWLFCSRQAGTPSAASL